MREEIVKLLRKEEKLSEDAIDEIKQVNLDDFANLVKEIGKKETKYINASEISKDLDTKYIGKDIFVFNEVSSTNTVARFLSNNGVKNGTVVISEKQCGKIMEIPIRRHLVINYINP